MYNLYYWSHIQGRGEFIRLALEAAGAEYVDVVRQSEKKGGGRAAVAARRAPRLAERRPQGPSRPGPGRRH